MSPFSVGNFLSHSTKNFREEPFNIPEIFGVSQNFMLKGVVTQFFIEIF